VKVESEGSIVSDYVHI